MSTSIGTLTIEMAANIARLKADMDRALSTVDSTMDKIRKSAGLAVTALGAIGAGLSVAAFTGWVKAGLDAADALDELSQRTGVAVQDLAGLQLAFKMGGVDAGALQGAMTKLSVAVAGGNDALRAMGIETRAADGSLKSTRQVLGEVADKFDTYEDGAAKATLAVQLFGKTGTDLLSVLAGGSEALDEFDAMARKLGLTIDSETAAQAAKFNDTLDLMGQGFKGIATQVAANLLPTLSGLADEFFTTMTEGDRLKQISDVLSMALKGVYVAAVVVIEAVATLGKTLMTAGKQFLAIMKGDFKGATDLGSALVNELQTDWATALGRADRAWNTTGSTAVEAMATASRAAKKEAPIVNEETKKMAAESAKLEAQYHKLIDSIEAKTEMSQLELSGVTKLTDGQKIELKIKQDLANGTLKLTDAQKKSLQTTLDVMLATEAEVEALKDLNKTKSAAQTLSDKLTDAQVKGTDALRDANVKLMQQNEELRIGKEAFIAREVATMRATATDLEFAAATVEGNEQLAEQARLLRQQADLVEENALLTAAEKTKDAWKETTETIDDGWKKTSGEMESNLTDALMRGFESGKGFGQNLADTLENMFKTLILKPIIQPVAQGASNMLLNMMGMGTSGSSASGGGGGGASGMMQGLTMSMQAFGSTMGTGFVNTILGTGGGASMSAAQSMFSTGNYAQAAGMGAGTLAAYGAGAGVGVYGGRAISNGYAVSGSGNGMVNAGTALGMVLGGPIGAAIGGAIAGGVNRLFGRKQTDMGIEGTLTTADGIEGTSYQFMKGGFFRSNKTITSALATEVEVLFDSSIELITKQTRGYAAALGLPANFIDSFTQQIKLSFQGLSEEEINQKIADTLVAFQEGLAAQYASALEPLKIAGETFSDTIQRLIAIQDVSFYLNEFGGAFSNFATASISAKQGIIDLAGGLDQLVQKTQGFVANFYTKEEQAGITARGVVSALEQSGFTAAQIAALETRADFRTLLESLDVNTTTGQQQFVTLLNLQESYAGLSTVMEEQQATLLELVGSAPQVEILQKMFESDAAYQSRVEAAEQEAQAVFKGLLSTMDKIDLVMSNLTQVLANNMSNDSIVENITSAETAAENAAALELAKNAVMEAYASIGRTGFGSEVNQIDAAGFEHWVNVVSTGVATIETLPAIFMQSVQDYITANPNDRYSTYVQGYLNPQSAYQEYSGGGFASGGYMDGPALVGEHGPELFDPARSQIYTAPATSNIFGGAEVAAEIRALRDEVTMLRSESRATAVNTSKMVQMQDSWDVRGLTVRTDADQPLNTVAA